MERYFTLMMLTNYCCLLFLFLLFGCYVGVNGCHGDNGCQAKHREPQQFHETNNACGLC